MPLGCPTGRLQRVSLVLKQIVAEAVSMKIIKQESSSTSKSNKVYSSTACFDWCTSLDALENTSIELTCLYSQQKGVMWVGGNVTKRGLLKTRLKKKNDQGLVLEDIWMSLEPQAFLRTNTCMKPFKRKKAAGWLLGGKNRLRRRLHSFLYRCQI